MNEGISLARQRQYDQAEAKLKAAAEADGTHADAFYNLALVYLEQNELRSAKDALEDASRIDDGNAKYYDKLGTVLMEEEDFAGAADALEKAIKLDESMPRTHLKLAQARDGLGDDQGVIESLTEAVMAGPRLMPAYLMLGQRYHRLGYGDHALRVYRSALDATVEGSEEMASVHYLMGNTFRDQKQPLKAVESFRTALSLVKDMPDALFALGWLLADQGQASEAVERLERFVAVGRGSSPPHYLSAAETRIQELKAEL